MFTQRLSMDCTQEQYEKYLKNELLKMGYEEIGLAWGFDKNIIVNNFAGFMGNLASLGPACMDNKGRLYLGSFNPELFLALAAMTDNERIFGYREWAKQKRGNDFQLPEVGENCNPYWRKATKKEIMERFGKKKSNHNTLENKLAQLNKKGQVEVNISFDATGLNKEIEKITEQTAKEISEAMSDIWYKIDQYHIAALKSNGYKIMRKTETWEEV